jgi:hypothetical protein
LKKFNTGQLASFVEVHQDFEAEENHWQRVMYFGDRVITEDNSREIIIKSTNQIAK